MLQWMAPGRHGNSGETAASRVIMEPVSACATVITPSQKMAAIIARGAERKLKCVMPEGNVQVIANFFFFLQLTI